MGVAVDNAREEVSTASYLHASATGPCSSGILGQLKLILLDRSFKINGANCGVEALILGAITSVGGFLFGYDTGQISAMLLFRDFVDRFAQTNSKGEKEWVPINQSLLVSLMSIGCLFGALSGA